jgi:hypothetical protein
MRDSTKLLALGRVTPAVTKAQIQVFSPAGEGLLLFSVDAFFRSKLEFPLIHIARSGTKEE